MLHNYESLIQVIWVLGRVCRPRRVEVIQTCIELHNDDCHDLYHSPDINEMTESRMKRWFGYVACTGKGRNAQKILIGNPEENRPFGRTMHHGNMILKCILNRMGGCDLINLVWDNN